MSTATVSLNLEGVAVTDQWADVGAIGSDVKLASARVTDLTVVIVANDGLTETGVAEVDGVPILLSRPTGRRLWHGSPLAGRMVATIEPSDEAAEDAGQATGEAADEAADEAAQES